MGSLGPVPVRTVWPEMPDLVASVKPPLMLELCSLGCGICCHRLVCPQRGSLSALGHTACTFGCYRVLHCNSAGHILICHSRCILIGLRFMVLDPSPHICGKLLQQLLLKE
ncbi:hypothetical protein FKM82_029148 [Ascaphus truei]